MKYVQCWDSSDTLLILYDGHRSHAAIDLIKWVKENNICCLFFLRTLSVSHNLWMSDVLGPLQLKYNEECLSFAHANHRRLSRNDMCGLSCRIYANEAQQGWPAGLFSCCIIWRQISINQSPTPYWMHPSCRLLWGWMLIFLGAAPEDLPRHPMRESRTASLAFINIHHDFPISRHDVWNFHTETQAPSFPK